MRVLVVAPEAPPYGGMALQAQQLVSLLRRDGVDVARFASNFRLPKGLGYLERVPGVRTLLRASLVWWHLWHHVRRVEVVHILAASWLYFFVVVYPAVLVGRALRKRVVVNYRGGEAREFFDRVGSAAAPAFTLADAVTAPSEFLASVIRRRFGVPVTIVPNLVDSSLFSFRQRTRLRPALLVTRHLEKIYDIETVLRALRAIQAKHPEASLCVAGSGSQETHLRGLAAAWALPNVRFLGEVAHRDLPALYDTCDIYINASRVDNFPGALVEASAAGLAVVTTGAGGIPFIYTDNQTAVVVSPGDWEGLANGIERLLQQPALAIAMTTAAREIARACNWSEVRKSLFQVYGYVADDVRAGAEVKGARCVAG